MYQNLYDATKSFYRKFYSTKYLFWEGFKSINSASAVRNQNSTCRPWALGQFKTTADKSFCRQKFYWDTSMFIPLHSMAAYILQWQS